VSRVFAFEFGITGNVSARFHGEDRCETFHALATEPAALNAVYLESESNETETNWKPVAHRASVTD
jgi:hypothetical protein